jgi:hypothetical protein
VLAGDLVTWLNDNSGAVQAAATVVLMAITGYYALLTRQLVRETVKSQRPYVYFELFGEGPNYVELGVNNYGSRAAENITFDVHRTIRQSNGDDLAAETPLARGLTYLPPGRGLRFSLYPDQSMFEADQGVHVLDVTVHYAYSKHKYEDRIVIDLADLHDVLIRSLQNTDEVIARELKKIASALRQAQSTRRQAVSFGPDKRCRFCIEPVSDGATKCPHCLSDDPLDPA